MKMACRVGNAKSCPFEAVDTNPQQQNRYGILYLNHLAITEV